MNDDQELTQILTDTPEFTRDELERRAKQAAENQPPSSVTTDIDFSLWQVLPNGRFRPGARTRKTLPAGAYRLASDDRGLYLQHIRILSDDIVELPEACHMRVLSGIRKFWKSRDRYRKHGLIYKRGVLLWGPAGCHAVGTEVVLYDGGLKRVEDVQVGDELMGPDGTPRRVLELCCGYDDMYRLHPVKGEPFDVNGHHILSLVRSTLRDKRYPTVLNTSLNEYIALSHCSRRSFKLRHSEAVEFGSSVALPIDPYFLGVWLGDGSERGPAVTTADKEIEKLCYATAEVYGLHVRSDRRTDSICWTHHIASEVGGQQGSNGLLTALKRLNLIENKHIPEPYLVASVADRLQLLAGMIDTDGGYEGAWRPSAKYHETGVSKSYFSITQKSKTLSYGIVRLARSLGLGSVIRPVTKTLKSRNFSGTYFKVSIYGDIQKVPVRIPRKKAIAGRPNKDPLRTGIERIEPLGIGQYFGFTLSGDHLYLTGDFVVHHNSGKTVSAQLIMNEVVRKHDGIVLMCEHPKTCVEAIVAIRMIESERQLVVVMEDIDEIVAQYGEHALLALLDGEYQIDNVVFVATTNYPERLGARIVNRPSRFDERIKIGMPSAESRHIYLRKTVGYGQFELDRWVADTEGLSIAHLRELVVAVVCLEQPYEEVIERLRSMEIRPKEIDGFRHGRIGLAIEKAAEATTFRR